jgi:hypothetical protein
MGGYVPLGYNLHDRKLVVNKAEAAIVREIFKRFVEMRSATALAQALAKQGVKNKRGKGSQTATPCSLFVTVAMGTRTREARGPREKPHCGADRARWWEWRRTRSEPTRVRTQSWY